MQINICTINEYSAAAGIPSVVIVLPGAMKTWSEPTITSDQGPPLLRLYNAFFWFIKYSTLK